MTVLDRYERLECPGIWRPEDEAQRRNVHVSLGDASLIIRDRADTALAHWSLPAVERINPGVMPALYRPGSDGGETLELADPDMIDAIATVARTLARARARPGRLRLAVVATMAAGVLALALLWLPDALVRHTARILPDATRAEIGQRVLDDLEPVAGVPCAAPGGVAALAALEARLFPGGDWRLRVMPGGPAMTAHLPGGILLLHRRLVEDAATPEAAAGALIAETVRAGGQDPMIAVMQAAGPWQTLRLLTRGTLSEDALTPYADTVLTRGAAGLPSAALSEAFAAAAVGPEPWRAMLRRSGRPVPDMPAGDIGAAPVLSDGMWIRLQEICQR